MVSKIVACHQANFLPWLGYFAKMLHADIFFLLDDVQFTQGHNKHNWTTRVRILTNSEAIWLTVPVKRSGAGRQLIKDVQINISDMRWLRKSLKTIETSYKKAPYFEQHYPGLRQILTTNHTHICELNIKLIEWLANTLALKTKILRSSEYSISEMSNQRLIKLTKMTGGTTYLSGDGADDYQVKADFDAVGLRLEKMGFVHPTYKQRYRTEFMPGLSIIDALFNVGPNHTRELLQTSRAA